MKAFWMRASMKQIYECVSGFLGFLWATGTKNWLCCCYNLYRCWNINAPKLRDENSRSTAFQMECFWSCQAAFILVSRFVYCSWSKLIAYIIYLLFHYVHFFLFVPYLQVSFHNEHRLSLQLAEWQPKIWGFTKPLYVSLSYVQWWSKNKDEFGTQLLPL